MYEFENLRRLLFELLEHRRVTDRLRQDVDHLKGVPPPAPRSSKNRNRKSRPYSSSEDLSDMDDMYDDVADDYANAHTQKVLFRLASYSYVLNVT